MTSYINQIQLLKFVDDTKCFKQICTLTDSEILKENVIALFTWSRDTDLNFNIKNFVHLSFKRKLETTYTISDITIPCNNSHKDLGLELSDNLGWEKTLQINFCMRLQNSGTNTSYNWLYSLNFYKG